MKLPNKRQLAAVLALTVTPVSVWATNGMFMIGYGAKSVAMGGTAIANPQDSLSGATNPATITEVGMRADVEADIFMPNARATMEVGQSPAPGVGGQVSASSSMDLFLIPAMGGVMPFNRKIIFGFSAVGAGGGGTRYPTNLYFNDSIDPAERKQTLGVSLMVMQMNPTAAYRLNKDNSIGASLVMSIQQFRAEGLGNFAQFTSDRVNPAGHGNNYSFGGGLRLGWLGKFFQDQLEFGVSGTTRIFMKRLDKYNNLFAQQGSFDTPPNFGIGLSYKPTDKWTLAFDVSRTFYSSIHAISNLGPNPGQGSPFPTSQAANSLGQDAGLGFGWKNQDVYKLGAAYAYDDHWTFRAGWNYGKSPIPEGSGSVLFSALAPAVTQHHLTLGTGYALSNNKEVNLYYMHAFRHTEYGPTYIVSPVEISMKQDAVGAELSLKF